MLSVPFSPADSSVTVTEKPGLRQVAQDEQPELPKKRRGRPATGKALTPAQRKARSRYESQKKAIESPEDATITGLLETLASLHRDYHNGKEWAGHHGVKICRELLRRFEAIDVELQGEMAARDQ